MADLSAFPITRRWAPMHPDRLQLYSLNTPNGIKAGIMLEECGVSYEPHLIDIGADESHTPEFLSLNPNGKIPAIIDPDGPGGEPLALFESGAILLYLAHKTGRFLQPDRFWETTQWVMWQMGGLGPMAGQLNFFAKMGGADWEDKRPRDRFADEVKRLLGVLDGRLQGREWIVDEYSVADIACIGWARAIRNIDLPELTGWNGFGNVQAWLERGLARPAVERGLRVTAKGWTAGGQSLIQIRRTRITTDARLDWPCRVVARGNRAGTPDVVPAPWPRFRPKEDPMPDDNLKTLVAQGLSAMKAGSDVAAKATDEIGDDATHPDLKAALDQGNQTSRQWAERIERAVQQAGGGDQGQNNPVLEAHFEVSRRIRQQAPDAATRDLGIIASGQLALHYWIAAFGTMANYTRQLGAEDAARDMKMSADEAKQADEQHTQLAERLLSEG